MSWVVHKFGGSSLADAEAFRHVGGLLDSLDDRRQAVVVSAMQGTTDAMIELARAAAGEAAVAEEGVERRAVRCEELLQVVEHLVRVGVGVRIRVRDKVRVRVRGRAEVSSTSSSVSRAPNNGPCLRRRTATAARLRNAERAGRCTRTSATP